MDYIKISNWPPDHAQKAYDDGYYVEALQVLHGWVEIRLEEIILLLRKDIKEDNEFKMAWDLSNEFSLINCSKFLFCIGSISKNEYDKLMFFNKCRNNLIHKLFHDPYDKTHLGVPKNQYDEAFNAGMELSDIFLEKSSLMT
jgi:hypothetical protein